MRRAMIRPDRNTLMGNVEVHDPKGFGRVRMKRISDMSGDSLIPFNPFICENVQQTRQSLPIAGKVTIRCRTMNFRKIAMRPSLNLVSGYILSRSGVLNINYKKTFTMTPPRSKPNKKALNNQKGQLVGFLLTGKI